LQPQVVTVLLLQHYYSLICVRSLAAAAATTHVDATLKSQPKQKLLYKIWQRKQSVKLLLIN